MSRESKEWYQGYLGSGLWEVNKNKARKRFAPYYCSITNCDRFYVAFHHYLGYEAVWTDQDYLYIAPVCKTHHALCHWTIFGKIPLERRQLQRRYKYLCRHTWRRKRPSDLFNWLGEAYRV